MILLNYILMCLIFGTTFLAIKIGLDAGATPFFSAGIRFFLAGVILFLILLGKTKARFSLLFRKEMFIIGMTFTFGVFAALYWAEQHISSGVAAILTATSPFMIMLLQTGLSRQRFPGISWAGCAIGFIGVIILIIPGISLTFSKWWLAGCLAILVGEIFYSVGAVYSRQVIERFKDISPILLNSIQMIHGGLLLLLLSLFTEQVQISSLLTPGAIIATLYLVIFGSMIAYTILYWLIAKTNPVFPSTWLYISPLIAFILGAVVYDEPFSLLSLIGGVAIIVGSVLVNLDSLKELLNRRKLKLQMNPSARMENEFDQQS